MRRKGTYHCIKVRDLVNENCCTCCRDADGARPGRGPVEVSMDGKVAQW